MLPHTTQGYIIRTVDASLAVAGTSVAEPETSGPQRVDLALEGMTCAACAARIEKVLNRVPGARAAVNFATESATVSFDAAQSEPFDLIDAVERAGYGARVKRDAESERREDDAQKALALRGLTREFWIAAALTLPLLAQMVPMVSQGAIAPAAHVEWLPRWLQ